MKPFPILIGLSIWLASLGGAYYLGQKPDQSTGSTATGSPGKSEISGATRSGETPLETPLDAAESPIASKIPDLETVLNSTDGLSEAETRELLAEAFALPENDYRRGRILRELLGKLAESNPEEALRLASNIGSLRDSQRARNAVLEVWGRQDPQAALIWAGQTLTDEPYRTRREQILAIYNGFGAANPEAAFESALAMSVEGRSDQRIQNRALEELIEGQIENGGLTAAKLQVEQLENGPIKERLLREMIDEWASFDPKGAAAYVETLGDTASSRIQTALLGEWAENDPTAAAAWLSEQAFDEATVGQASTAIIREWTRYDMAASAEWLNSLPSSPELDRAVMNYTYRAAQEDPASAMTWAESINNDWVRTRMMERVAGRWKEDAPENFQNYLDSTEFTEEQRKRLRNASASGGRSGR